MIDQVIHRCHSSICMEKEKPLWHRIYYSPVYTEIARIVGYSGITYRDLMDKLEPLRKQFGGQAVDSAVFNLATYEGDTTCNVKPLAHVRLRDEARHLCWQLLGPPLEKQEAFSVNVADTPDESKPASPPPPAKKKRKKLAEPSAPPPPTAPNRASIDGHSAIMQQYRVAKEKHPDMLLLFRMGDFYELFDQDAETAHKLVGLTLTTRDRTVAMAGFPHHQLETYLHKLLKEGQRVAVCEPVEESLARGPIRREVTRVVTPVATDGDDSSEPA